jgi:hypothetical protein
LVTPEEEVKPQPQTKTEEEEKMDVINAAAPTPPPPMKPSPPTKPSSKVQAPSSVLDGILSGMGSTGAEAAKALGITPKPQATGTPALQVLRESTRVKAVSNKKTTAPNAHVPLPDDPGNLKDAALVLEVLGEPAASDYEAASVLCEIWRKA